MTAPIQVLLVDDSSTSRRWLKELFLRHKEEFTIIGEASNGMEALANVRTFRPDVIIMDLLMPQGDGIEATKEIMGQIPTPIVILSGMELNPTDQTVIQAMQAGALSVVRKPPSGGKETKWERDFLGRIRAASRIRLARKRDTREVSSLVDAGIESFGLLAIGASAGGPPVIGNILKDLPVLSIPTVIVLHYSHDSHDTLLSFFETRTSLPVVKSFDGMKVADTKGRVVIARPGVHLTVEGDRFVERGGEERNYCKPSIDIFFESVAKVYGKRALAVLLTGMGKDGAQGLKEIRNVGGTTIAQDEATSTVYGMPRAAIEMRAADMILPDTEIAKRLIDLVKGR